VGGNPRLAESYGGSLFEAGSVESLCESLRCMAETVRQGQRPETARRGNSQQVIGWDEAAASLEKIIQENLTFPVVSV